jgi:hypothetical protein
MGFSSTNAIVLTNFFKSGLSTSSGGGTGRAALYTPFLFGNFFFAALVPKKKWVND